MIVRGFAHCVVLVTFAGCATYDYEGASHYRQLHQNTPVFVSVTDDLDRTSRRVRLAREEMGADAFDATVDIDKFAQTVRQTMRDYGIVVADSELEAQRSLAISIDEAAPFGQEGYAFFGATVTYSEAGEKRSLKVDSARNTEFASSVQQDFTRLAQRAVESALLMWHPSESALDVESPWGSFSSSNYSLFPTSPIGNRNELPFGESLVLTWETMPSERILAGSGISPDRISDVSYELQVGLIPFKARNWEYVTPDGPITLETASFDLGDKIPWCGRISWTFRARFMLDGHPRVTAWSTPSMTRVGAPHGIECYSINWGGGLTPALGAAAATTEYEQFQLEAFGSGARIASIALSPSRCDIDEKWCSEVSHQSINEWLHQRLQDYVDQLGPAVNVVDGAKLIDPDWFGESMKWYEMTADDLSRWLADEANRSTLLDAGVQRIFAVHVGRWEIGKSQNDPGSSLTLFADIFDIEKGQHLAGLEVTKQGPIPDQEGSFVEDMLFDGLEHAITEALYGDAPGAFTRALSEVAQIGALAMAGARIGWPESLVSGDSL